MSRPVYHNHAVTSMDFCVAWPTLLPLPFSYVILSLIQPMNSSDYRRHPNGAARLVRIMAGAVVLVACAGPATETALPPTRAGATATAPSTPSPGGSALLAFASDR